MENEPKTLIEAVHYFSDADNCHALMRELKWPAGTPCPKCGHNELTTDRIWPPRWSDSPECIHFSAGICDDCRAAWEEDPEAFWDFGDHPEGIAAWAALQAEMEAARANPSPPLTPDELASIPY